MAGAMMGARVLVLNTKWLSTRASHCGLPHRYPTCESDVDSGARQQPQRGGKPAAQGIALGGGGCKVSRLLAGATAVAVLLTLVGCGGGGDNAAPPEGPAPITTRAYVDTACRDGADGFS